MTRSERAFENSLGKGENTGYKHFSPFPTHFSSPAQNSLKFIILKCFDF